MKKDTANRLLNRLDKELYEVNQVLTMLNDMLKGVESVSQCRAINSELIKFRNEESSVKFEMLKLKKLLQDSL